MAGAVLSEDTVFSHLLAQEENKHCVDCGRARAVWATATHGAFICIECSGQHRSLGVHVSFVRSVTLDEWTQKELHFMLAGGNGRLRAYWRKHGLLAASFEDKYTSPAMARYRESLKRAVEAQLANPSLVPSMTMGDASRAPDRTNSASGREFFAQPHGDGDAKAGTDPPTGSRSSAITHPKAGLMSGPASDGTCSNVDLQSRIVGFGSDPFYIPRPTSPLNPALHDQVVTTGCLSSLQSCVVLLRSLSDTPSHRPLRPLGAPPFDSALRQPTRPSSAAAVPIHIPQRTAHSGPRQSSSAPAQSTRVPSHCVSCSPPDSRASATPPTPALRDRRAPSRRVNLAPVAFEAEQSDGL